MANPHLGEVEFEAGGVPYTLRFSIDALCALEEKSGKGFPSLCTELSDPGKVSLSLMRMMVWAALRDDKPDLTLRDAGELIIGGGGMQAMMVKLTRAIELAFPQEASGKARPRKPGQTASTGSGSAAIGAVSRSTNPRSGKRPHANSG